MIEVEGSGTNIELNSRYKMGEVNTGNKKNVFFRSARLHMEIIKVDITKRWSVTDRGRYRIR